MNDNSQISVLIATYNGEKFLAEQLESILSQTRKVSEVVMVDDLSSDNTIEIAKKYKKFFLNLNIDFKIFINKANKGYANNFWNGFKLCTGNWIYLCDQDDVWLSNKVEDSQKVLSLNKEITTLNMSYQIIDQFGNKIHDVKHRKFSKHKEVYKINILDFIKSPRYPGMSMVVRKDVVEKSVNMLESVEAHDWMVNLVSASQGGMYFYDKILSLYRQHTNNTVGIISKKKGYALQKGRIKTIDDIIANNRQIVLFLPMQKEIIQYADDMNIVLDKRKENVSNKCIFKTIVLYLSKSKYYSRRCFYGDLYVSILMKFRKNI